MKSEQTAMKKSNFYFLNPLWALARLEVNPPMGPSWIVKTRYRAIRELHEHLRLSCSEGFRKYDDLPVMPQKRLWGNKDPAFIAERS